MTFSPGLSLEDPLTGNTPLTITISGLPRHSYLNVHGAFDAYGHPFDGEDTAVSATVQAGGQSIATKPLSFAGNPDQVDGTINFGQETDAESGNAFKHSGSSVTITITPSGLPDNWNWWPTVYVQTYFPFVSVNGSGTVVEDGTGKATFTVTRPGNGDVLNDALTVNLKDGGAGDPNAARPGKRYNVIGSITIPAHQNAGSADVAPVNDKDAEGVQPIYEKIVGGPDYALSAPPATAPNTNFTNASANEDDDVAVHSVKFILVTSATTPNAKAVDGARFMNKVQVIGEHLDKVVVLQSMNISTKVFANDGVALTPDQTEEVLPSLGDGRMVNTNGQWKLDYVSDGRGGVTEMPQSHLAVTADTKNGEAITDQDIHSVSPVNYVTDGPSHRKYTFVADAKAEFRDIFMGPDAGMPGEDLPPLATFDWGYGYSNKSYAWRKSDNPPAPLPLTASPAITSGDPHSILTGHGDGFNSQDIPYVEEIDW